tara:strand:+ start:739 stop:933 length:195 start_codon:yes stop_codon:yes gene_type:complete
MKNDSYLLLQFFIAEKLGKTHREIRETMSTQELYAWSAYYTIKSEQEEKAYEDARRNAQTGKVR